MKKISLQVSGGKKVVTIDFPEQASEIKLAQYIDFDIANRVMLKWMEETELDVATDEWQREHVRHLLHILSEFTRTKLADTTLPVGDLEAHLMHISGQKDGSIDFDNWQVTLTQLYAAIFTALASFTPQTFTKEQDCVFEYKGKKFKIPTAYMDAITGKRVFPSTPAGLVVEALEIKRLWQQNIEADKDGSLTYTSYLKLVALLVKEEGQELPLASRQRLSEFIEKRIRFFADIPMNVAMNIHKWLLDYYGYLESSPALYWFFNPPKPAVSSVEESRALDKAKLENEARWKRSGYQFILHRTMKSGYFNGLGKTPYESARLAPFEETLEQISLENAVH